MNNSMHRENAKTMPGSQRPQHFRFSIVLFNIIKAGVTALATATLLGCQGNVMPDFERIAGGMQASRVMTPYHQHLIMRPLPQKRSDALHVYIEGDGRPWIKRFQIAKDPTPYSPLVLQLMRRDANASLFLGRPCYFNHAVFGLNDTGCDFTKWTSARYSANVVSSMVAALRQAIIFNKHNRLVLIGYSGGGTLAMLMAQEMEEVDQIITIAANLDIDAWTQHHHFSPLSQSLNPAHIHSARPSSQHHFAGSNDRIVPPQLNRAFLQKIDQRLTVIDGFNHRCCWADQWPELLKSVQQLPSFNE